MKKIYSAAFIFLSLLLGSNVRSAFSRRRMSSYLCPVHILSTSDCLHLSSDEFRSIDAPSFVSDVLLMNMVAFAPYKFFNLYFVPSINKLIAVDDQYIKFQKFAQRMVVNSPTISRAHQTNDVSVVPHATTAFHLAQVNSEGYNALPRPERVVVPPLVYSTITEFDAEASTGSGKKKKRTENAQWRSTTLVAVADIIFIVALSPLTKDA